MGPVIPADFFSLHLFSPGLRVVETVVDATIEKSEPVSCKTTLTPEARQLFQEGIDSMEGRPGIRILDDLSQVPEARQLGMDLGTPDASCLVLHLFRDGRFLGIAALTGAPGTRYSEAQAQLFLSIHLPLAITAEAFQKCRELERVREMLTDRAAFLNQELMNVMENEIVGAESGLKTVMASVGQVAGTNTPVLLLGETGTGKEVIARAIHRTSPRKSGPFIGEMSLSSFLSGSWPRRTRTLPPWSGRAGSGKTCSSG